MKLRDRESIVIPAEWFVGKRGAIAWSVDADIIWVEETGLEPAHDGGSVALYYRVEGENIIYLTAIITFLTTYVIRNNKQ